MLDKSLCYLDGRKDLWNKMLFVYPVKLSKKLKKDEIQIKAFILWATFAMDISFGPDNTEGFDNIDIYKLSLDDVDTLHHDFILALLLMFFIEHGYHSHLAATFFRIKGYECGNSFKDLGMFTNYENKLESHFIARDLCFRFSLILNRHFKPDEIINMQSVLIICYRQLLKLLKDNKAMNKIDFELLQLGFKLESKIDSIKN